MLNRRPIRGTFPVRCCAPLRVGKSREHGDENESDYFDFRSLRLHSGQVLDFGFYESTVTLPQSKIEQAATATTIGLLNCVSQTIPNPVRWEIP